VGLDETELLLKDHEVLFPGTRVVEEDDLARTVDVVAFLEGLEDHFAGRKPREGDELESTEKL